MKKRKNTSKNSIIYIQSTAYSYIRWDRPVFEDHYVPLCTLLYAFCPASGSEGVPSVFLSDFRPTYERFGQTIDKGPVFLFFSLFPFFLKNFFKIRSPRPKISYTIYRIQFSVCGFPWAASSAVHPVYTCACSNALRLYNSTSLCVL